MNTKKLFIVQTWLQELKHNQILANRYKGRLLKQRDLLIRSLFKELGI